MARKDCPLARVSDTEKHAEMCIAFTNSDDANGVNHEGKDAVKKVN